MHKNIPVWLFEFDLSVNMIMSSISNFPENDIISFSSWLSNVLQYTFIRILSSHQLGQPSPIVLITQLVMVKRATISMPLQVSLLHIDLHSFQYMPKSGMTES
jgi:hypothetical protein